MYYMREQHQAAEMASVDASGSPKRDESRKSEQHVVLRFSQLLKDGKSQQKPTFVNSSKETIVRTTKFRVLD